MARIGSIGTGCILGGAAVLLAAGMANLSAQGPGGGRNAQALFARLDANGDGTLTRSEIEAGFNSWVTAWATTNGDTLTGDQIAAGLNKVLPAPTAAKPGQGNTFNIAGNSKPMTAPQPAVDAMMAGLPSTEGVKPLRPRKVLVLAHTGPGGFVHASIPLTAKTVEALAVCGKND
jgi:hypothetical protein